MPCYKSYDYVKFSKCKIIRSQYKSRTIRANQAVNQSAELKPGNG